MEVTDRIRATQEPELIEALTYRFVGHSRSDPGAYRPEGELERWRERDPLVVGAAQLRDRLGDEGLKAVADEVEAELALIETSALAAPFPEPRSYPEFKEADGS